jgi:solute carrier family 35 (UDP-sugar transporter), member A1/2/3
MRYAMKDQPKFLTSAAVLGSEFLKLSCSVLYILLVEQKSLQSIVQFLVLDRRNTLLLAVPASAYNFQMSMEYVALANLNAAMFSVLVQSKLLFTATFAAAILGTKLKYIQVISLCLLTCGVMLCNLSKLSSDSAKMDGKTITGIMATLAIALSSGFASVYTEKVIKGQGKRAVQDNQDFGLAYTQVQLAFMSIVTIGAYAAARDWQEILEYGLWHNFTTAAFLSVASSALGGLIVASVLKYADSVLKGYATAMSVILTGCLSMILFGTQLNTIYFMGIINVVIAVGLYNGKDLDQYVCSS